MQLDGFPKRAWATQPIRSAENSVCNEAHFVRQLRGTGLKSRQSRSTRTNYLNGFLLSLPGSLSVAAQTTEPRANMQHPARAVPASQARV